MRWAAMHSAVLQEILTRVYVYLTYVLDATVRCEERERVCGCLILICSSLLLEIYVDF